MRCLVKVDFLPGGSLPPAVFFSSLNAIWSHIESPLCKSEIPEDRGPSTQKLPVSGLCIADYDSIEQLSIDLAIMPGAGIAEIEVIPLSETPVIDRLVKEAMPNIID